MLYVSSSARYSKSRGCYKAGLGQCCTGAGAGTRFLNICAEHKNNQDHWGTNNKLHIALNNKVQHIPVLFSVSVPLNDIPVPQFSYESWHLIKPQSTFPSLLAASQEHPWSPRAKENSGRPGSPIGGGFLLAQDLRLNTDWSIHLGIQQRSTLRKTPNYTISIVYAFLLLEECGQKEKVTGSWEWFSLPMVGRDQTSPPGMGVILWNACF